VGTLSCAAESLTMRDVDIVISQLAVSRVGRNALYCSIVDLTDLTLVLVAVVKTANLQISNFGFMYALILCAQKRAPLSSRAELIQKLNNIFAAVIAAPGKHLSHHSSKAIKICGPGPALINTFHGERSDQVRLISPLFDGVVNI
jgi:hypothetical protein